MLAVFLTVFVVGATSVHGLRFDTDPVTSDSGILTPNRPSKLTCNYVKFKTENVREIVWYAGYNGMKTKIFHYHVTSGTKEGSTLSFIKTDEATATPTTLVITLTEFRSPVLNVGCEVEVLRDSGYGKLKTAKKLEESNITVVEVGRNNLIVRQGTDVSTSQHSPDGLAVPGEPLTVSCIALGLEPSPVLTLHINGQPWEERYSGQIVQNSVDQFVLINGQRATASITGRLSSVSEDMFQSNRGSGGRTINIECLAKYNDQVVDQKELIVRRSDALGSSNPFLKNSDDDLYLAPEVSRPGERRQISDPYGSRGSTYNSPVGSSGVPRSGRVYDHEEIHSRLLELVDPARHNHPGIPYDFFSGYILMIADNMDQNEQPSSSYGTPPTVTTTTIVGKLPDYVIQNFQNNYGRYNQISNEKFRLKMDPIEVLNTLGTFGYRVVNSAMTQSGKMIWTIEHRKFELERSPSSSYRGREL